MSPKNIRPAAGDGAPAGGHDLSDAQNLSKRSRLSDAPNLSRQSRPSDATNPSELSGPSNAPNLSERSGLACRRPSAKGGRLSERPVLVAEIGGNHGGDPCLAEAMIEAAASAGVSAVKFQAYQVETFLHPDCPYYEELANEELSFEDISRLVTLARKMGLAAGLTVFDMDGLALAESSGADFVKISSGDLTYERLLLAAAKSSKRLIISTGASFEEEVEAALRLVASPFAMLQCASLYPAPPQSANLAVMAKWLAAKLPAGLSDHCLGLEASVAAMRLGAVMIERHMTIDRSLPGGDNSISSLPEDFALLREAAELGPFSPSELEMARSEPFWGNPRKEPQPGEEPDRIRRVAVAARDLSPGETAAPPNIAYLRPPSPPPLKPLRPNGRQNALLRDRARKWSVILENDLGQVEAI